LLERPDPNTRTLDASTGGTSTTLSPRSNQLLRQIAQASRSFHCPHPAVTIHPLSTFEKRPGLSTVSRDSEFTEHHLGFVVTVYILDVAELVAEAESRLTRWWTKTECRQYLDTDTCPVAPEHLGG
jgi:hypothetical protein